MAAYTQIGYGGYPSATQLLSAGSGSSPHIGDLSTQQSTEAPSQSSARECCSTVPAVIDTSSGAMSPDGMSQTSNAGATGTGTAVVSTNLALPADVPSPAHVATTASACCENGRPIVTDPVSGQTVCSCQYDARIALSSYSRLPAAGVGVYGTPYPSTDQNPYQSIGVDSSAFYPPLSNPYALKDSTTGAEMTAWTSAGLQPTTGYYSYDPMAPYGYGASYDLAARRKNATRESTATLKAWLNEHKKNPYPTKGEKIMLAIITKMTLTQVSTWFANARRRLKKENKMTWEPKNRTDDDDDALASDDDKDKDEVEAKKSTSGAVLHERIVGELTVVSEIRKDPHNLQPKPVQGRQPDDEDLQLAMREQDMRPIYPGAGYHGGGVSVVDDSHHHPYHPYHHQHPAYYQHQQVELTGSYHPSSPKEAHTDPKNQQSRDCGVPIPATKPKIWSLADTVACKTPPPPTSPAFLGQQQATPLHMNSHSMPVSPFHQQQPQKLQQEISQFHMAADYTTVAFSRGHTVVYGGLLGSSGRSHYHDRTSSSTSSTNNLATTPTTINPLDQPQLQQQHPHQHQHQQLQSHIPHAMQQQMGFPEVQPETPPQTPPNMKVQNLAVNLLLTGPRTSMTHTCHSANQAYDAISLAGRLGARFGGYSLEEDSCSRSSSGSEGMSINSAEQFQPILKSQRMAEFVSTI